MYYLNDELKSSWQDQNPFTLLNTLDGKVYREIAGRRTFRFELNGKSYFAKLHGGVGWGEIIKNLLQLRLPVVSARNEWQAIRHLEHIGVATMTIAGYGITGINPATVTSFIVTEALQPTVSLEDYCRGWKTQPPAFAIKLRLLREIASISGKLHRSGLCHRDYYLCHFLMHETPESPSMRLSVIDLHRALIKRRLATRWTIKDIAGLYYSAMNLGLSQRDLLRFVRGYEQAPLREVFSTRATFWTAVARRATAMYNKLGPVI